MSEPVSDADRERIIAEYRARAQAEAGGAVSPEQAQGFAASQPQEDAVPSSVPSAEQIAQARAARPAAGAPLPAEDAQDRAMSEMRAQFDALVGQLKLQGDTIESLQKKLTSVAAGAAAGEGEPFLVRYAKGVRDKLLSHAIANADLGAVHLVPVADAKGETVLKHQAQGHFASVLADAEKLVGIAEAVTAGDAPVSAALDVAGRVLRFFDRGHRQATNKHVDFSAARDDLEAVQDEAAKLAA